MIRNVMFSKTMILAPALALAAACGNEQPRVDDALRNDLSLATQAQQYRPQQYVSPQELAPNGMPYAPQPGQAGYAPNGYYAAPAPAPAPTRVIERERVVYRNRSAGSSSGRSSGGYSSAGTTSRTASRPMKRNTKRDAAIGAAAGAAIGVATSRDKLKGGIIGGVAGAVLGGVIGNNVDVKRYP